MVYCSLGGDAASAILADPKIEPVVDPPAAAAQGLPTPLPTPVTQPETVETTTIAVPIEENVPEAAVVGEDKNTVAQKAVEKCGESFN